MHEDASTEWKLHCSFKEVHHRLYATLEQNVMCFTRSELFQLLKIILPTKHQGNSCIIILDIDK